MPLKITLVAISILVSGCWLIDENPELKMDVGGAGEGEMIDDSIVNQLGINFEPLPTAVGQAMSFEAMMGTGLAKLVNMRDIKIPIFYTDTLKIIPFPDEQGHLEPPSDPKAGTYCANDYLVGELLTLDDEWIVTEVGDCFPTGSYTELDVQGNTLLGWRAIQKEGMPEPSILKQLESF